MGHKSSTRDTNTWHDSAEALFMSAEMDVEEIEDGEEEEAIDHVLYMGSYWINDGVYMYE